MKKVRENNIKKIIAVILTLIMVLCSIPFDQWILNKAYAESETRESSIIEVTDDNGNSIHWAKVVVSYEKGNPVITEEKNLQYDKEKKGYKLADEDYAELKDEVLSNIKVSIDAEGFEKITDDTSLITTVNNEKKTVTLTSNFTAPAFQIELAGDDSQYIYTGSSILLIKSITGLSKANVTQPQGEPDNLSYITTTYEYNVEYSLDNKIYQNDVPAGTNAQVYNVYVKVSEKASKYTHTDMEFNKETAIFDSTETKYIIKHKEIAIKKAQLRDEQFQFDLTNATGAGTQDNPILVEWNKGTITYPINKTISDGKIAYRVEDSLNNCSIDADSGELSFNEKCIDTVYPVYASITDMQNYEDKEICYYIKVVKQNLDKIQFSDIIKENGEYKKTITYGEELKPFVLIYGDSKENVPDVKYNIKSQKSLDGDKVLETGEEVAVIDEDTGILNINRSGVVVVSATINDNLYQGDNGNTYNYTLTIEKKRHDIHFENILSPVQACYGDELNHPAKFIDEDSADDRKIKYTILDNNTIKDKDSTIDENGKVTIHSVCSDSADTFIIVTATVEANDKYAKVTATYTIKSSAAEQSFEFDNTSAHIYFGQDSFKMPILQIQSGSGNNIVYKLQESDNVVKPVENGYVSINNEGEILLDYKKITEITPDFTVQVMASLSGCPKGSNMPLYKTIEKSYILQYHKAADDTKNKYYEEEGENNGLKEEELWYRGNVTLKAKDGYQLAKSIKDNWDFKDSIIIEASVNEMQIYYRNTETNIISIGPKISLKIDKTAPQRENLKISYINNKIFNDIIFNDISGFDYRFGASKNKKEDELDGNDLTKQKYMKVTLTASDTVSGIGSDGSGIYKFKYWGECLKSTDNNSKPFQGEVTKPDEITEANSEWKVDGDNVSYTFTVPNIFKGKINFTAYDKAGNELTYYEDLSDNKTIIVADDTAPQVELAINNNKSASINSTNPSRIMKLKINDAVLEEAIKENNKNIVQYYYDNTVVNMTYTPFYSTKDSTQIIPKDISKEIKWSEKDKNIGTYEFTDEGKYTIKVSVADPAGNVGESEEKKFKIDTTPPNITSEMSVVNLQDMLERELTEDEKSKKIVNDSVKLTVTVKENDEDFSVDKMDIKIDCQDINGKDISNDSTKKIIQEFKDGNWTVSKDEINHTCVYTKSILFEQDARYHWKITCEDESKQSYTIEDHIVIDGIDENEKFPNGYGIIFSKTETYESKDLKKIFFGKNDEGNKVKITITARDNISGIEKLQYSTDGNNYKDLPEPKQDETDRGKFITTFTIENEYNNNLYIKGIDRAKNESTYKYDKVIILDTTNPELSGSFTVNGEKEDIDNIKDGNTYKTDSILASIEVTEEHFFQEDLQCIGDYTPFLNGKLDETKKEKIEGIPIRWEGQNEQTAVYEFTKEGQYNVTFKYKDKSDNEAEPIQKVFYIDRTPLKTTSSLEGTKGQGIKDNDISYYSTNVSYTIFIKENRFSEEDLDNLTINVSYVQLNGQRQDLSEVVKSGIHWEKKGQENIINYVFQKEGYYEVSYSYTSKAGENTDGELKKFYIDKTNSEVLFEYLDEESADSVNTTYYKQKKTAQITVKGEDFNEFNPFDPEKISLIIERKLNSESEYNNVTDVYAKDYNKMDGWEKNGNDFIKEIKFDEDADYKIEFSFTDNAGRQSSNTERRAFTVDLTNPQVTVSFTNTDVRNENQFKAQRTATIRIEEHNFQPDRVKAIITARDVDGSLVSNENGAAIEDALETYLTEADSWDNVGDIYTAYITFERDANYTFDIQVSDMAGHSNVNLQGKNVVLYEGVACNKFTIDTVSPTGSIKIADWTQSKDGTVWNKFLTNITFALWLQTDAQVVIDSKDSLSGIEYVRYCTVAYPLTEEAVKQLPESIWTTASSFTINPNTQFIVYAQIMDRAGNELTISSDGVILDNIKPAGKDSEEPTITIHIENRNDIYNQNVQLSIFVKDPAVGSNNDVYSGIKKITYQVENKATNTITQNGILYEFTKDNPTKEELVNEWSTNQYLVIETDTNNSNDIVVSVTAIDNAGNISTKELSLAIDTTKPRIEVHYDNNDGIQYDNNSEYKGKTYFKTERTATIDIIERNFNADDIHIDVASTDGILPDISDWSIIEGTALNGDDTIHRATVHYYTDGDYTFDISYNDMAGNIAEDIVYGGLAPQEFTIDTINPAIHVSYGEGEVQPLNINWFKQARTATVTVVEHNFDATKVDVTVTAKDMAGNVVDTVNVEREYADYVRDINNWAYKGDDTYTIVLNYKEDAHYTFDISMTDLAGRKNVNEKNELYVDYQDSIAPNIFVVDKSTPVVMSTYTSNAAAVNENHYNQDMNLEFTVNENNFYKEDAKVEVVYTPYNGAVNENYGENVTKALKWENPTSLDTWTAKATYIFTDEGKYTVTISYMDKAGNVCKIDPKEFYIDKTKPQIKFEYLDKESADSVNTTYYKQARTAKITIIENDFNPKNIQLHILRRLNSEQIYTDVAGIYAVKYDVLDGWEKDENGFVKEVEFNEDADYEVALSFTDDAGNQADIERQVFTVDLTSPQVNVTFSNTDVRNSNQFRNLRTATITVIEHNFQPDRVNAIITAVDINGSPVYNENGTAIQDEFKTYLTRADSWENVGDIHTAHIVFERDANYTFDIIIADMAGRDNVDSLGKNVVVYTGIACNQFTIDTTRPTGSIKIADWTQSKDGILWDKFLTNITFGLWLQTNATVVINSSDNLSGIEYVRYYTVDHSLTEEAVKALPESVWTKNSNFRIEPDARFIVYARIMDNAGNEIIISSDGVILDNTKPAGDGTEPRITIRIEDKNNIYNQDVRLDISVEDPAVGSSGVYSGIREITCTVTNRAIDMVTQDVLLYEFENDNPKQEELLQEWSLAESFVVDQSINNSNDVIVAVTAIDNAGNSSTKYLPLAIDITAPRIEIYYDNDDGDSSFEETTYFKAERTATIDIIERNFNADDVNINVTSTDDTLPNISDWTIVDGTSSNGDDTIHRAIVNYYADGDYTFDISYTDMAGNEADNIEYSGLAPQQFTIDSVLPVISVAYDNNDAINGNYYNQTRTATVTIEEHNFETSRIVAEITTEGGTANIPQLSDWSTIGDTHTATISYTGDTLYGFALQYTDMAGNQAVAYERDSFYVDTTMPELSIQRIENESANKEELIAPVITFTDQYYDRIDILLNGENADGMGFYDSNENGGTFTFNNIIKDDIYTLSASVIDKAGNLTQQQIVFSVNRNGSTYDLEASTEKINGSYIKETKDIIVYEINPDPLLTHKVTLYKNGKTVLLTEGTDYRVDVDGGSGSWYKYIYNIFAKNFDDDGVYRLSVQSTDKAGNIAENTIDTKNREISFGVDNTMPNIMLLNLESGKTYAANSLNVMMSISDNLKLSSVLAYVDDMLVREWTSDEIMSLINASEDFAFDIDGTSTNAHYVRIVAVDAAGNSREVEARDFYVTTNIWIRFYTNTVLFWGSIGIGLLFIAGVTGIVFIKKRKKKKQR